MKHKRTKKAADVSHKAGAATSNSIQDLLHRSKNISQAISSLWDQFEQLCDRDMTLKQLMDVEPEAEDQRSTPGGISRAGVDKLFEFSCQLKFPAIVEVLTSHFSVEEKDHKFVLFAHHPWLVRRLVEFLEGYFGDRDSFCILHQGYPNKAEAVAEFFDGFPKQKLGPPATPSKLMHGEGGDDSMDWSPRTSDEKNAGRPRTASGTSQQSRVLVLPMRDEDVGKIEIFSDIVPKLSVFFLETDWMTGSVLRCERAFKLKHRPPKEELPPHKQRSKDPSKKSAKFKKDKADAGVGAMVIVHKHLLLSEFDHMNWERLQPWKVASLTAQRDSLNFQTETEFGGTQTSITSLASNDHEDGHVNETVGREGHQTEVDYLNSSCKSRQVVLRACPFLP
jgi:hypothetical protein